jgi:hypothetical protein
VTFPLGVIALLVTFPPGVMALLVTLLDASPEDSSTVDAERSVAALMGAWGVHPIAKAVRRKADRRRDFFTEKRFSMGACGVENGDLCIVNRLPLFV